VKRALLGLGLLVGAWDVALALLWRRYCRRQGYGAMTREIERWAGHAR
jgi:hypothetical protein